MSSLHSSPLGKVGPWGRQTPALVAVGIAALPKCPLCLMAVLGAAGLGAAHGAAWLWLSLAPLAIVVAPLAAGAARRRSAGPLIVGLAATALVLWGRLRAESRAWVFAGLALLVAAALWSHRRAPGSRDACPGGCDAPGDPADHS